MTASSNHMKPSTHEIEEQNEAMRRRQVDFRVAAQFVSDRLIELDWVRRVVIIGSVAVPLRSEVPRFREFRRHGIEVLHECSDLDLAVWVTDLSNLRLLQQCRSHAVKSLLAERGIGVAHHQVELFLLEPDTDRYVGRLCTYGQCPKQKPECRVANCGAEKFLRQIEDFSFRPGALASHNTLVLFDKCTKR